MHIVADEIKTGTLSKAFVYTLRGQKEDNSEIEIVRKYSDFYALRQALVKRWPGCFVPPVPEKANIGLTDKQISKNKLFLVTNFLNKVLGQDHFANGEELKIFI